MRPPLRGRVDGAPAPRSGARRGRDPQAAPLRAATDHRTRQNAGVTDFGSAPFVTPKLPLSGRRRVTRRRKGRGGDAFVAVPSGADAYVLKGVIHDWEDKDAIAILRTCRSAMPDDARLLLIERVLPERIDPHDAATQERFIADIQMFVNPGGRERTEAEFRDLLTQAGLRMTRIVNTAAPQAVMEVVLA
jgi:hypothetical protein